MHVLLVKPEYYSKYPAIGLLKIATYHRNRGDSVEYIESKIEAKNKPDIIYITSLYTYAWKEVHESVKFYKSLYKNAKIILGGIYASLMPEHAKLSGADEIHIGLFEEAEDLMPAYDLVPNWDGSIVFASRGCIRNCPFCAVPIIEGKLNKIRDTIKPFIYPKHKRIILWDNNILASPKWRIIFDELEELNKEVDFNQGIDIRLITDEVAERLSRLKTRLIRISYDDIRLEDTFKKAVERLISAGINRRKILVYVLYNFKDTPQDFFERIRQILELKTVAYPMRFEPIDSLKKNSYISPNWTQKQLSMISIMRKVLGVNGTLTPNKILVDRFRKANSFDEAFRLY